MVGVGFGEPISAARLSRLDSAGWEHYHVAEDPAETHNLAADHRDKLIFCLDPVICPCSTMYRIHPAYLAWVLETLVGGHVLNEIVVPERVKAAARVALDRMLSLPGRMATCPK